MILVLIPAMVKPTEQGHNFIDKYMTRMEVPSKITYNYVFALHNTFCLVDLCVSSKEISFISCQLFPLSVVSNKAYAQISLSR
ncbi:hypothetical protein Ahy_A07g032044 isoform B [Arachis hypogaea]|uniref:Uncharacterized protein n=1 Tax=Arachis hypogaea TaxID=3818 RepID=A0A445C5W9_ARAHY|nr:hypothetical protein Ahy_A07g032044 isoform B [Arachis hypogaea]